MGVQTGRTIPDFTVLKISSGAAMVDMKIDNLGEIGLDYEETDIYAWSDAVKGALVGQPDFSLDFGGPVDNTATTGPSTILRALNGVNTALSFDIQIGVRHAWVSGEQQFGCSAVVTTNSGVIVTKYKEADGKYSARLRMATGSATATIPAWGVAAEVVPAG